jgi:hypothetical protein
LYYIPGESSCKKGDHGRKRGDSKRRYYRSRTCDIPVFDPIPKNYFFPLRCASGMDDHYGWGNHNISFSEDWYAVSRLMTTGS